uniref:Uncharacterized protein n=1 Tax=Parascaris equorum TaxID=6256 RepID=A0A914RDB8_PAREQ
MTDMSKEEAVYVSALRFFDKYVREACENKSASTSQQVGELPIDAKVITIEFNVSQKEKMCAEVISSSICAILQLLCTRHSEPSIDARSALMDLFFPAHGRRPNVWLT